MNQGLTAIRSIIEKNRDLHCRLPAREVLPELRYREDLGLDSLAMMAFLFELQELYPDLNEKHVARWLTVSDTLQDIQETESR
jgi:acyl carrier protein